jgi:hypothetical protein
MSVIYQMAVFYTHCVSITRTSRLMAFREAIIVCCEKQMQRNIRCKQNGELFNAKEDGTYSYRRA